MKKELKNSMTLCLPNKTKKFFKRHIKVFKIQLFLKNNNVLNKIIEFRHILNNKFYNIEFFRLLKQKINNLTRFVIKSLQV
jgi:hypothetical protein